MGIGNSVTTPAGVICPMLLPLLSANQKLPSGPATRPQGALEALVIGNSLIVSALAVQLAFVPVFAPLQVQLHGPEPLTADAVPELQRLAVGAIARFAPLLLPQPPFTIKAAEQESVVPVFAPLQVQLHGPLPLTADAVPEVQRLAAGAALRSAPLLLPQAPLTIKAAEQESVVPVFAP